MKPHRVEVYTCEEVLVSIYGEDQLALASVKDATEMFEKWITARNAMYVIVRDISDPLTIMKAILGTISAGKDTVVLATLPPDEEEGCDDCGECGGGDEED